MLVSDVKNIPDLQQDNLEIMIGPEVNPNVVVALVTVNKETKYRRTHVRVAASIEELLDTVVDYYPITSDELISCVKPLFGFTTTDIFEYLGLC